MISSPKEKKKTVLIISCDDDRTTNDVIDWLIFFRVNVIRINDSSTLTILKIVVNDSENEVLIHVQYPGFPDATVEFDLTRVDAVWYRRGRMDFLPDALYREMRKAGEDQLGFLRYIERTNLYIESFAYRYLKKNIRSINSFFDNYKNKLFHLTVARELGLNIPNSLVTSEQTLLRNFITDRPTITKALPPVSLQADRSFNFSGYTSEVTLESMRETEFSYSLLQEKLDKKYELRIFYLNKSFFASAIFSQADEQTSVDFRKYNRKKPNRVVPYRLPEELKEKLTAFMMACQMASGSIDIVYTKSKKYVFLEVNPIGQFRQVSEPCNYFLEKKVAEFLAYGT